MAITMLKQGEDMRTYAEIMTDVQKAKDGHECRKLHNELKKYGDGLPLFMRYPRLPLWSSVITLIISIIAVVLLAK